MERLRRTLSFRSRKKRKQKQTESSKPHQWLEDERKVREGTCSFQVKYLGCVEVFESRGMQVCEEAHKVLRHNVKKSKRLSFRKKSRKHKVVQANLYISGDSLRVVEDRAGITQDDGQGLIVDQTIEKVSFCAPDRSHEKGFSYICRDGTSRRWMCHGFLALKESGERLSHAVGCAFAVCLEKKQKREKEAVSVKYSDDKTSFSRLGSFRQATLTERLADPQSTKVADPVEPVVSPPTDVVTAGIERPRASTDMLLRQGSFNTFQKLNSNTSPFKRNLSLRLNDLPSNVARQQTDFDKKPVSNVPIIEGEEDKVDSGPASRSVAAAITEVSPRTEAADAFDPIAVMCQQLTQGITGLNDDTKTSATTSDEIKSSAAAAPSTAASTVTSTTVTAAVAVEPIKQSNPWAAPTVQSNDFWLPAATTAAGQSTDTTAQNLTSITTTTESVASSADSTPQLVRPRPSAHMPAAATLSLTGTTPAVTNGGTSLTKTSTVNHTNLVASEPKNPFDTAWALRSNPLNPFLPNAGNTQPLQPPPNPQPTPQQFNKEFEIKM